MAAKDKHGDDIDGAKKHHDDGNEEGENTRSIAALFGESDFRRRSDANNDGLGRWDIYLKFGVGSSEEVSVEFLERLYGANTLSSE